MDKAKFQGDSISFLVDLSLVLLVYLGLLNVIGMFSLFLGVQLGRIQWPVVVLISAALVFFIEKGRQCPAREGLLLLCFTLCLAVSLVLSVNLYDLSWDGQAYHQYTMLQLYEGWNPVYQSDRIDNFILPYPCFSELASAVSFAFFKNSEIGKHINMMAALSSFFLMAGLLFRRSGPVRALFTSAVIAFNPVVLCQMFTYYVDGLLASVLSMLVFILWRIFQGTGNRLHNALYYSSAVVLACNTKFTGLVYSLIMAAAFMCLKWITGRITFREPQALIKDILRVLFPFFLALVVFGYYPYVTNIIHHHNLFYPLAGKNAVDVLSGNIPRDEHGDFKKSNRVLQFIACSLARPQNAAGDKPADLSFNRDFGIRTFSVFSAPDVRINGFGTWFPLILVLFAVLMVVNYRFLWKNRRILVLLFVFSMVGIFVNPAAWWARYVPQVWILIFFFMPFLERENWCSRMLSNMILATAFLNVLACGCFNLVSNIEGTSARRTFLSKLKQNVVYAADFGQFRGNQAMLESHGIKYREEPFVKCFGKVLAVPGSQAVLSSRHVSDWFRSFVQKADRREIKAYTLHDGICELPCVLFGGSGYRYRFILDKEVMRSVTVEPLPVGCNFCRAELQPPYLYVPVLKNGKICMNRLRLGQQGNMFIILCREECWLKN